MTGYGGKDLARSFRTVRDNTIQIAEDIPEDKYSFRPAPGAQSVRELLAHLAVSSQANYETHAVKKLKTFVGLDFAAWHQAMAEQQAALTTKAQIVDLLKTDGTRWAAYLEGLTEADLADQVTFPPHLTPPAKTRFEMILSVKEHEMHHRAQLMLVERLLGIVPHLTRRREAAMAQAAKG
ncbi:MAG TPA: DinB family protein [Vicinamibacterales bacterium]|nr:DinB family protein [Vicinamibacterales bacterium]